MSEEPLDPRSTGRKRARAAKYATLLRDDKPYACERCHHGPSRLPVTSPIGIKVVTDPELKEGEDFLLEVNHINKSILDCDESNLELLCRSCHKQTDLQTEKGVSTRADEFGYGLEILDEVNQWQS